MTTFPLSARDVERFVDAALQEDVGTGDITSQSVIAPSERLAATLGAREDAVVCGLPLAEAFFKTLDPRCVFDSLVQDGAQVTKGDVIARIEGVAGALLTAERSALNSLQLLSGIATNARRYVAEIKGTNAQLLDTRKTIPGYRLLTKYATQCGGAVNHRIGLFDAIMIKDNHLAVSGGVKKAIEAAQQAGHTNIQVECDTLDQAHKAAACGATSLLLDNMDIATLSAAVKALGGTVTLEASGGVTLSTIKAIAETGVDFVSVGGALTLSAQAIDIGMDYEL